MYGQPQNYPEDEPLDFDNPPVRPRKVARLLLAVAIITPIAAIGVMATSFLAVPGGLGRKASKDCLLVAGMTGLAFGGLVAYFAKRMSKFVEEYESGGLGEEELSPHIGFILTAAVLLAIWVITSVSGVVWTCADVGLLETMWKWAWLFAGLCSVAAALASCYVWIMLGWKVEKWADALRNIWAESGRPASTRKPTNEGGGYGGDDEDEDDEDYDDDDEDDK